MQNRNRTLLGLCLALFLVLGILYLRVNQDDYDRRTLMPTDYQELATEPMYFEKGTYTVTFAYAYAPDVKLQIIRQMTADENNRLPMVLASEPLNEGGYTEVTLTMDEAVHDLQFRYTDETELGFTTIESNSPVWHDTAAILFLITGVAAMFLWMGRKTSVQTDAGISEQTVRVLLLGASIFATLPILRGFFVNGHDLAYHLMRIENIKDGLLGGQFPVRVGPTFWNGQGYASSIMYPELFLYLPAALRLCGVSLMVSYQVFVFLINLATFFTAYHAMRRLTGKATIGLIVSLVYSLGVIRMITLFLRGATGEVLALIFFPCVMLGMYEALHQGKISKWLIIGMTGLIQTHVVSVEIAAIFCALYTVFALVFRKTNWHNLLRLAAAAGITLLLNLWFLVPFLVYSRETLRMFVFLPHTELHAVYPAQLFASFTNAYGDSSYLGTTVEMTFSVGLLLLVGLFIYILKRGNPMDIRLEGTGRISLVFGFIALLIASTLFPWSYVVKLPVLGDMLFAIQFPWRFLGSASFFLSIVFALGVYGIGKEHKKAMVILCLLLAVLNIAPFFDQFFQSEAQTVLMADKTDMTDIEAYKIGDYAYADSDFDAIAVKPFAITAADAVQIDEFTKHGAGLTFRYTADTDQTVTLPLYFYPGYRAVLNGAQALEVIDSENHLLTLTLPTGEGTVSVRYEGFWYFYLANFISLLMILVLIALAARKFYISGRFHKHSKETPSL